MIYHALAIDGPAGAGKSTVAKLLAKRLGYTYVDTGAMYRATTLKALDMGIDIEDADKFGFLDDTLMEFKGDELYVDGKNVTREIRSNRVSNNVSVVSSHIPVRNRLVKIQQDIATRDNVVMDGRDIGTVVLPNADLKIYMTATVAERARRRHEENLANKMPSDYETLKKEIEWRDAYDSTRSYNPLRQAEDAVYLDTSEKDINQVANLIYDMFNEAINRQEEQK
ncbi:MAG TPA: (d)CMP kinase [Candidatus Izemoplasmatales bacterium]|nr:(d)CMP kinase [Candidatus Izemoplasmatales bacterium]